MFELQFVVVKLVSNTFAMHLKMLLKFPTNYGLDALFFKSTTTRRELGMHAYSVSTAKHVGKQQKVRTKRKFKKDQNKNDLSERNMSLEDKVLFQKAKMDALRLFFTNGVLVISGTLTSRMLLKWSRNPDGSDGSPRAKARLVARGYTDAGALAGQLDTASPASTRLGRGCLLRISACLGWCGWSADGATAFLQGLPQ